MHLFSSNENAFLNEKRLPFCIVRTILNGLCLIMAWFRRYHCITKKLTWQSYIQSFKRPFENQVIVNEHVNYNSTGFPLLILIRHLNSKYSLAEHIFDRKDLLTCVSVVYARGGSCTASYEICSEIYPTCSDVTAVHIHHISVSGAYRKFSIHSKSPSIYC